MPSITAMVKDLTIEVERTLTTETVSAYSRLKLVSRAGAIDMHTEDIPHHPTRHVARLTIACNQTDHWTFEGQSSSARAARTQAAELALPVILHYVRTHPITNLHKTPTDVLPPPPSPQELIELQKDEEHTDMVALMRQLVMTAKDPYAGVICLDIETPEDQPATILDVGISACYLSNIPNHAGRTNTHFIVQENINTPYSSRLPDNKHNFVFGSSETVEMPRLSAHIQSTIDQIRGVMDKVFLLVYVEHHNSSCLEHIGYFPEDVIVCDLARVYRHLTQPSNRYVALADIGYLLREFAGQQYYLHNAGNHAGYMLDALAVIMQEWA